MRLLASLLVVVVTGFVASCGGSTDGPSPINRSELRAAFSAGGESLRIFEDSQVEWGEEQVLDSVFVPGSPSDPRPTEIPIMVALFRDEDSAVHRTIYVKSMSGEGATLVVHKNVSMIIDSSVPAGRREALVSLLRSL